jgi:hypothetical protein
MLMLDDEQIQIHTSVPQSASGPIWSPGGGALLAEHCAV